MEREKVKLWECPDCGFAFDAIHTDEPDGGYSCPVCAEKQLRADKAAVVEALKTFVTGSYENIAAETALWHILDLAAKTLERIESGEKG